MPRRRVVRFPELVAPKSERELCDMFRAAVRDWAVVYPEQGDWDMLVVLADGTQVGIQAKLKASFDVVAQALRIGGGTTREGIGSARWRSVTMPRPSGPGPDIRAVLVPTASDAMLDVAHACNVLVIEQWDLAVRTRRSDHGPALYGSLEEQLGRAPRWPTSRRVWVPPFVPDLPAGVPSPRGVSPWKVNAAKLCAELRAGLTPTSAEVEARVGSFSRWRLWLERIPGTKPARYRLTDPMKLPDMEFPEVARGLGLPWWQSWSGKWIQPATTSASAAG